MSGLVGYVPIQMGHRTRTAATLAGEHPRRHRGPDRVAWAALVAPVLCLAAGGLLFGLHQVPAAAGAFGAGVAVAVTAPWSRAPQRTPAALTGHRGTRHFPRPRAQDLYLELHAVEVEAVYVLGNEVLAYLRGGSGFRVDPLTRQRRSVETTNISLTWRCHGRRCARRQARRLNSWEAGRTPLQLLAAHGRCTLLVNDDEDWLQLPELRITH